MIDDPRVLWDNEAASFDRAPDHGLYGLGVRDAWRRLMLSLLPPDRSQSIADLGCGTGSLSLLLAETGHHVSGVDFAPKMLEIARRKAVTVEATLTFAEGDAADPPLPAASFDTVLSRHVLWAMPDPAAALRRWRDLLRPGGQIILIEGSWSTGAGITGRACAQLVQRLGGQSELRPLSDPALWGGGPITDERYVAVCRPADDTRSAATVRLG